MRAHVKESPAYRYDAQYERRALDATHEASVATICSPATNRRLACPLASQAVHPYDAIGNDLDQPSAGHNASRVVSVPKRRT
jgi:hypothetical protein